METTVESLEDSRVKLHVEIPAADFEPAIDAAFTKLAQEVKLPGFRPGKAPRKLLEQRLGTQVAREQALRDSLPEFYAEAVLAEGVDAIAAPEIEITSGEEGGDVTFNAVVEVRPKVEIQGYQGMRVVIDDAGIDDSEFEAQIDAQIDRLREQFADLEDSSAPLTDGDYAQIDLKGSVGDELVEGLSASDFLYEVGSGSLLARLDDELRGAKPGDILEFTETLPENFGERSGQDVSFRVLVKDAKRKVLPELTDEWVQEASEFETVDELRDDVRHRMDTVRTFQLQLAARDRILESLADLVLIEAPDPLVKDEMQKRLHDLVHRLESRGASLEQYVAASGLAPEEFIDRVRDGATKAVKADLALRALVDQEAIEVTEEEFEEELGRWADRVGRTADEVRAELGHGGGLEAVRSEVARGKALQFAVDHSVVVDGAGNEIDMTLPAPATEEPGQEHPLDHGHEHAGPAGTDPEDTEEESEA
ncbi:MAG TPA: trigger factor [Acidimicrobiia bacterium]|nr:trigger factor [Acidimicrobiia bacterium]